MQLNKKQYFTIIILTLIAIGYLYISGILGVLGIILSIYLYSIIAFMIYYLFKKIKIHIKNLFNLDANDDIYYFNLDQYKIFLNKFLYSIAFALFIVFVVMGSFVYYQNDISPAKMPVYTLTNGDKTLVFQSMSHIGSQNFYDKVEQNIRKYKKEGYVYYLEGVQLSDEQDGEDFNKALGVELDDTTYDTMSELFGISFQDNSQFMNIENNLDYNVDLNISDIMNEYRNTTTNSSVVDSNSENTQDNNLKDAEISGPNKDINTEFLPINMEEVVSMALKKLTPRQLEIYRYINKSFLNAFLKSPEVIETIAANYQNQRLLNIILHRRNEYVADYIINSSDKKIIATYGLLHFDGIYELLKQNDLRWHISNVEFIEVLK